MRQTLRRALAPVVLLALLLAGCQRIAARSVAEDTPASRVTDIHIAPTVLRSGAKRFGINLSGQNFYDSGQMLRNLVYINPGFEGETWQSIIRCATVSDMRCTEANQWSQWPANFLAGAQFEFLSGPALGLTGTILSSDPANPKNKEDGISLHYARLSTRPTPGDFILVRKTIPGNAGAGWWPGTYGGGAIATETTDLAPNTAGRQAIRLTALLPTQYASVTSYFDSFAGRSFVQLHGPYRVSFRARGAGGSDILQVGVRRDVQGHVETLFDRTVPLTPQWQDYALDFTANETGDSVGTANLSFNVAGAAVLLDDVSLAARPTAANPTAYRDEVVETLRALHPGVLRYQDGDHLGSSIDNLIAPVYGRQRAGWSERASVMRGIPVGLPEVLQLAQLLGAEPWINLPSGISPAEAQNLIEYLGGAPATPYGAKRAASGQVTPWTDVFSLIHLELGNEEWNGPTFAGTAMDDPFVYGERARLIFLSARASASYQPEKFDLVLGSFSDVPEWTRKELSHSGGYDSTAIAPYLYNHFNDDRSDEAIFGPMFAQPEYFDSLADGTVKLQAGVAASAARPAKLAVYEVNLSATEGTASQASFDRAIPSLAAGLALADHMLLMLRDDGITTQSIWSLPGYQAGFQNPETHQNEHSAVFGVVVDMGGQTNLKRPVYLAEKLANQAILPNLLTTQLTGANPWWEQKQSPTDHIRVDKAHELQTFAFAEGVKRTLIILNLSRTQSHPVTFSGEAPAGAVKVSVLTSAHIDDTNEASAKVAIRDSSVAAFDPHKPYDVPPYSMTVLSWTASQ